MTVISDLRDEQRGLVVGDKVVVYVPYQRDFDKTYWEGTIVGDNLETSPTLAFLAFYLQRDGYPADVLCLFHHTFCFPERLRGRVRYLSNGRLKIMAEAVESVPERPQPQGRERS